MFCFWNTLLVMFLNQSQISELSISLLQLQQNMLENYNQ